MIHFPRTPSENAPLAMTEVTQTLCWFVVFFFFKNFPAEELLWQTSVPSAKGW